MTYKKPVIELMPGQAESIYAASGSECWSTSATSTQNWNGTYNVFRINATHTSKMEHASESTVFTITFNNTITKAYSEFPCNFYGNTVEVTRALHANGYPSGDNVSFTLSVASSDEASTKALQVINITQQCNYNP